MQVTHLPSHLLHAVAAFTGSLRGGAQSGSGARGRRGMLRPRLNLEPQRSLRLRVWGLGFRFKTLNP